MEQLGPYRVSDPIGTGRFATVLKAQEGGKEYALKILEDELVPADADLRTGLAYGLENLTRLGHPSAVQVFDAGETDGKFYIVTELMKGPTLDAMLAEKTSLAEQKVVLFVRQAAQALDMARDVGLFHGDLNAKNVFVASEERIRLSDFAVRAYLENPRLLPTPPQAAEDDDAWAEADDLLGSMDEVLMPDMLEEDFVALSALMMRMLGAEVPAREEAGSVDDYRRMLLEGPYERITGADSEVSVHVAEVARRLLTAGGFDSPGEVVVELASAMLLRRTQAASANTATKVPPAGAQTAQSVSPGQTEEPPHEATPEKYDLEPISFAGDPRDGTFTPFFMWANRHSGRFFCLFDGDSLAIGRDPDVAELVVMDPAMSRRHCLLTKDSGVITAEDLGSTNGTFLNEERITGPVEVVPGDCLRVGATRIYMTLAPKRSK